MVESLARGETARVTIGGVRERSARRQRRQPMLGTEEIEIDVSAGVVRRMQMPAKAATMKTRLIIA